MNNKETKSEFSVFAWSLLDENTPMYCHWSTGLKMSITKDGVNIKLTSEEIQELVKCLPRTVGGSY